MLLAVAHDITSDLSSALEVPALYKSTYTLFYFPFLRSLDLDRPKLLLVRRRFRTQTMSSTSSLSRCHKINRADARRTNHRARGVYSLLPIFPLPYRPPHYKAVLTYRIIILTLDGAFNGDRLAHVFGIFSGKGELVTPEPGLAIADWPETEGRRPVGDRQAPAQACSVTSSHLR